MSTDHAAPHTALLGQIEQYLQLRGCVWTLRLRGGLGLRAGSPDLLACLRGRLVAVEAKTGRAQASASQRRELARLEASGALTCVARSVDQVEDLLVGAGLVTPALEPRGRD